MSDPTDEHALGRPADSESGAGIDAEELARLERKARDIELLAAAHEAGIDSWQFKELERELVKYALPVMRAWIRSEAVYVKASELIQKRGGSFSATPQERRRLRSDTALRDDLLNETLVEAIKGFRAQVSAGTGWDPDKGADIRTFFTNGCVLKFISVFRRLLKPADQPAWHDDLDEAFSLTGGSMVFPPVRSASPESVLDDVEGNRLWDLLTPLEREIIDARLDGYSTSEIAEICGLPTPGAVRAVLQRLRQRMPGLYARLKLEEDQ
ncbi:RNA polymerase sigma factor [Nocardia sp. NPDC055029]